MSHSQVLRGKLPRRAALAAVAVMSIATAFVANAAPVAAASFEWTEPVPAQTVDVDWGPLATDDSGVYFATPSSEDFIAPSNELVKYDPDGNPLWTAVLPVTDGNAWIQDVAVDDSGVYISGAVTGHFPGNSPPEHHVDAFVAKYTPDGAFDWAVQLTPPSSGSSNFQTRVALATGTIYLMQDWINGRGLLARLDPDGAVRWHHEHMWHAELASLTANSDGPVVALIGDGLWAYSPSGALRWSAYDAIADRTWDIVADPSGGTYALQVADSYPDGPTAIWVRYYGRGGSDGAARVLSSRSWAYPTGLAVFGDRVFASWYAGYHLGVAQQQGWAELTTGLDTVWSRSAALPSGSESGYMLLAVGSRGGFLEDGGTLAKFSIDGDAPVSTWQDYVFPIRVPLPDDYVTGLASWSGKDNLSGIDHFDVEQSSSGGQWTDVTLKDPLATSALISEKPGASYQFRVRATDKSGNVGKWSTSPTYQLNFTQDTSQDVTYDSNWSLNKLGGASGGTVMTASKAGATAEFTFKGDSFGFVTVAGPDRGKVAVYVDGSKVSTIDLYSASEIDQYVAFSRTWAKDGSHTVTLVVKGTAGRPRVDVDGFEVQSTK